MSTDSSLLTAELTIELEETENEDLPTPIQEYVDAKKLAFTSRYQPLREKELHFNISEKIKIGDLTPAAMELLENHLNLDEVGTMLNWQAVAAKLGLNMDSIEGLITEYGKTRGILFKCSNMPLIKLLKSLGEAKRIDTLYSLHILLLDKTLFKVNDKHPLRSDYSSASTAIVSSKHAVQQMESGSILVVSYYTPVEKKDVKHLIKHFRDDRFNKTKKPVYLLEKVVSDENIEQSTAEALRKAEHVVFCFTPSLLDLIDNAETSPLDLKSRSVASISRMAIEEYWSQQNRNTRFRAVTFEAFPADLKTVGWAKATIEYNFPRQAHALFKRIFENILI